MATQLYANNAGSMLALSINAGDLTLQVAGGFGALFPSPTGGDYFLATLMDASGNREIVKCTGRATDVFTIVRAQEGTTAQAWTGNACRVECRVTKGTLERFLQALDRQLDSNITLLDNVELRFGTGLDDLAIYHNGANNFIESNTGSLSFKGSTGNTVLEVSAASVDFFPGTESVPGIRFSGDANSGFYQVSVDIIGVTLEGANQLRFVTGSVPLRLTGISDPTMPSCRIAFYTEDYATERGYWGYPTSGSDNMILRNTTGDNIDFRCSDNIGNLNVNLDGVRIEALEDVAANVVRGGTYTPTLTNISNLTSVSVNGVFMYTRVGDIVHVVGRCDIDAVAAGTSRWRVSLPIASDFSGVGTDGLRGLAATSAGEVGSIIGSTSDGGVADVFFDSTILTSGHGVNVDFTYRVI